LSEVVCFKVSIDGGPLHASIPYHETIFIMDQEESPTLHLLTSRIGRAFRGNKLYSISSLGFVILLDTLLFLVLEKSTLLEKSRNGGVAFQFYFDHDRILLDQLRQL
jgi:hypothetical protein